jgi:nitrite reductase/ring-hydroxylating ferredoxin subunit
MTRAAVAKLAELPPGARKVATIGERSILVLNVEGRIVACANVCPHARYPLEEGPIEGGEIVCILHGFGFRLEDGAGTTDTSLRLEVYPVAIEGDDVVVELPDPPQRPG